MTKYLLFLILVPFEILAHLGSIVGVISEKRTSSVLSGATISIVGTQKIAIADEYGQFSFNNLIGANYKLEIRNIGYETLIANVIVKEDETIWYNFKLEPSTVQLNEIEFHSEKSFEQQLIGKINHKLRPINNSQEFLRNVPGLFIGQHAGGGKAEQIFLRGFDIDHGTDIQINTDGIPVNMVSHAHGQGYAEMHFVIPELVNEIKFQKGLYNAAKGNFATAGFVELNTKTAIEKSEIKFEVGQFNTYRGLGIFDLLGQKGKSKNQTAYVAGEYNFSDGYFENPQDFNRINLFGKYHGHLGKKTIFTGTISSFFSKWNASGQIPNRAVTNGQIGYFGAIDPNEGGVTSRQNINFQLISNTKNNATVKNQIYFSNYNFDLFSNFTFFLRDSINGDQIKQFEKRKMWGYNGSITKNGKIWKKNHTTILGLAFRADATNNTELSYTKNRNQILENIKLGDINELNLSVFADETIQINEKFNINTGIRFDYFNHKYFDKLLNNKYLADNFIVSPKLNLSYTFNKRFQTYLYTGKGFHSNDTRVVIAENGLKTLPAAYGVDLGLYFKPFDKLIINPALWYLRLNQEFIYVGDEGVVEPSGRSNRFGVDLSLAYQIAEKIYFDFDFNATKPRAVGLKEGNNYLPLAPIKTSSLGLTHSQKNGLNTSIRGRYISSRPANENNTIVAKGYFITDATLNYTRPKYNIGITVQNLFNNKWKETQFATESKLQNEIEPVEEIHFTPGSPFFAKINFSIKF